MANKTKRIDLRISEKDLSRIDRLAEKAKMSRSQYLLNSALGKQIIVIESGGEIARQFSKIGSNVNQLKILAHQGKINIVYLDRFAEEVKTVWQSLSSLISQTKPTSE
jgi:hypothetical protein